MPAQPTGRLFELTFGRPRGVLGRVGAAVMIRANAEQDSWAVGQAALTPGARVLVVGLGPGVGLAEAASAVAPGGRVIGVDPSPLMRDLAERRCGPHTSAGVVEIREDTASSTGLPDSSLDVAISVNNVHRRVLDVPLGELEGAARAAGFTDLRLSLRSRTRNSSAVALLGRVPG